MTDRATIFAVSSGAPPAGIAVLRISGPRALGVAGAIAGTLPEPRRAALRVLRDPHDGSVLDRAIVLVFPGPRTATGEDCVEFHLHGGRAVVAAVEAALYAQAGTRRAEAGEFTRRALENGVIDLTEAEGLGDLLAAQTEGQRRAALRMAEGGVRARIERWSERLVGIAARIEAQLDFSDEDDVADEAVDAISADIGQVAAEIDQLLSVPAVERLHHGVRIVIAGPPNSGKSTLLNALTGRDVAIVSPISGTTRDRIEAAVVRGGLAYILTDTAGLTGNPGDEIERIGIDRARAAIEGADIVLWLDAPGQGGRNDIRIHARADLPGREMPKHGEEAVVSAQTGVGIDALWTLIAERAAKLLPEVDSVSVNERQRALLARCRIDLAAAQNDDMLIVAEEIRRALGVLDEIAGRSGIEDVLDAVFARFCIGK
ncbi:tRNA uridine-5-carboxymethylaminomethyl(34) synthesis GTPase MnmE [Sphingomonas sp. MMS24-J45]|uniref:tRNA uridine-5-carboxymethylaminomethyl(34) synthesis GTPase MnmE n=1 Tax=Sphingomonas sp. MMS24-J45 TaxID=3238806 RepID=UPI0038503C04